MSTQTKKAPTESDVYDRQIRLWGAESQAKMQNSKVLYLHVTGTSAELMKNLVLAGISATLCDKRPIEAMDSAPHFFTPTQASKKVKYDSVAHAVKPLVSVFRFSCHAQIEYCVAQLLNIYILYPLGRRSKHAAGRLSYSGQKSC